MTRIYTNMSSLFAQTALSRNNNALDTALMRLSTGLRINSAADDPAGMVASTILGSDIRATEVGIANSELANQMVSTSTSALSGVSGLLDDIRGLVNEAASSGTMSADEIAANQLEIDAALDAIDLISQVTQFQGKRLLDGSVDFVTSGVDRTALDNVVVRQARFGSNPTVGVNVELVSEASKGALTYSQGSTTDDVVLQVGGADGFESFSFDAGTSVTDIASAINLVTDSTGVTAATSGVIEWEASAGEATVGSYGANNDISITATSTGEAAGSYYVRYFQGTAGSSTTADITQSEVDGITGEITYGYIDVTLAASAETDAQFDDMTSGVAAATASDGTIDLTTTASGAFNATWTSDEAGANEAPLVTLVQGGVAQSFDASTNTYTITNDFTTGITSAAFIGQLNTATDGIHTFNSADAVTVNAVQVGLTGAISTQGTNGMDATVIVNATSDTGGTAGNTPVNIEFTNGAAGSFGSYTAGTNTYTVNIDNDNDEFVLSNADLVTRLNNIAAGVHTFDGVGGAGNVDIDVRGSDWAPAALTSIAPTTSGIDADDITATATEVVDAINDEQDVMIVAGDITSRIFTVANATGDDGTGLVAISEEMAVTGSDPGQQPTVNNMLQYQALDGMRDIRYVAAGDSTALSIDLTSYTPTYAQAAAIIDLGFANGTFELKAQDAGAAGNQDITIAWGTTGDATTTAAWDGGTSTLTINVANADASTVNNVIDAINASGTAAPVFDAALAQVATDPPGIPTVGDGTGTITTASPPSVSSASLTGGVVSDGVMVVNLATDANGIATTTANDLITYVENSAEPIFTDFQLQIDNGGTSDGTGLLVATTTDVKFDPAGTTYTNAYASGATHAENGTNARFTVTSKTAGSDYDDVTVRVTEDSGLTADTAEVTYLESSNTLLISYNGNYTAEEVSYLINTDDTVGALFEAAPTAGVGSGTGNIADGDFVRLSGGEIRTVPDPTTYAPPLAAGDPMLKLLGAQDVGEDVSSAMLTFTASNYGSSQFAAVEAVSGTFSVTNPSGDVSDRDYGDDVNVRINGQQAVGNGLSASISTPALQMVLNIDETMQVDETTSFSITGGGAQFQLGLDAVSSQQARIGIMSTSTTSLGGINGHGYLSELRSGGSHDLATDTAGAAAIVADATSQVTGLQGQLGAFQSTTLETNIVNLEDMFETLSAAQNLIRDTDYAAESSALVRAQILVEASTLVLQIANQRAQNVLSLIQ